MPLQRLLLYRGTSLIRNRLTLGPYNRPIYICDLTIVLGGGGSLRTRYPSAERKLRYYQYGHHVCTPTEAVSEQDLVQVSLGLPLLQGYLTYKEPPSP